MKAKLRALFHWHLMHKGESVCHFLYLGATLVEGHGLHAAFAGGVALFIALGVMFRGAEVVE